MKKHLPVYALMACFLILTCLCLSANAQTGESKIINKVPRHLPIKVKLLDADGVDAVRRVSFKITNTGKQPIYYLNFVLNVPKDDIHSAFRHGVFVMIFGRSALGRNFGNLANEEDVPLKPDENIVLSPNRNHVDDFLQARRVNQKPLPEKYELNFQRLNFGDGTGYTTTTGIPYPAKKANLGEPASISEASKSFIKSQL